MQIRVKCSCGEEKCPEWAIVELQGVVEVQPAFQHSFHNLQIGLLCRPSSQENYTFTVGYHELSGSKVPLKKPFLVMKKVKHSDANKDDDLNSSRVELEVVGIIRHRILFKTRPKALISSKLFLFLLSYLVSHYSWIKQSSFLESNNRIFKPMYHAMTYCGIAN